MRNRGKVKCCRRPARLPADIRLGDLATHSTSRLFQNGTILPRGLAESQSGKRILGLSLSYITNKERRPSSPNAPILLLVPVNGNEQIITLKPTLLFQFIGDRRVKLLFCSGVAALLENLDENQLVGACVAEVEVFEYHLFGIVLGDDLLNHVCQ